MWRSVARATAKRGGPKGFYKRGDIIHPPGGAPGLQRITEPIDTQVAGAFNRQVVARNVDRATRAATKIQAAARGRLARAKVARQASRSGGQRSSVYRPPAMRINFADPMGLRSAARKLSIGPGMPRVPMPTVRGRMRRPNFFTSGAALALGTGTAAGVGIGLAMKGRKKKSTSKKKTESKKTASKKKSGVHKRSHHRSHHRRHPRDRRGTGTKHHGGGL